MNGEDTRQLDIKVSKGPEERSDPLALTNKLMPPAEG